MGHKKTEWFVEPMDTATNDAFRQIIPEENVFLDIEDTNGKPHNVWQCSFDQLKFFWQSRQSSGLDFKVFTRTIYGNCSQGKLRRMPLKVIKRLASQNKRSRQKGVLNK